MKNCYNSKYDSLCGKGVHVIRKYVTLMRVIKSQNISPNQLLSISQIQMQTKWHIPFWGQDGKQSLNKYQA